MVVTAGIVLVFEKIYAQEQFSLKLNIVPSKIEANPGDYPLGYVYLVDDQGLPITAPADLEIKLSSDNSGIISVPNNIIIPAEENYQIFDVTVKGQEGEVTVSANYEGQEVTKKVIVGGQKLVPPKDLSLKVVFPTASMHVNSEMPFTVFLESDGIVVQAPKDIPLELTYEGSLVQPVTDSLTIKEGTYYAWSTIKSLDKIGTAFVKARSDDLKINGLGKITVSTTAPSALKLFVYPDRIPEFQEKKIDIFVTLVDSEGNPAVAEEDVPLQIHADFEALSDRIDNLLVVPPKIKKNEFGYYFQPDFVFVDSPQNYTITVTSDNYGIASSVFHVVESLSPTSPKVASKEAVKVFIPEKIPVRSNAIVVYQTGAIEDDDDDEDDTETEKVRIRTIDDLEDGEIFPVRVKRVFSDVKSVDNLSIVSTNNDRLTILKKGSITDPFDLLGESTYGTAFIQSGDEPGEVFVSVSLKGWGSGTNKTTIIDPRIPAKSLLFTPFGNKKIIFDDKGKSDLFVIPLDSASRPTSTKKGLMYLLKPSNEIIEVQSERFYSKTEIDRDFFGDSNTTSVELSAVGIKSKPELTVLDKFDLEKSSTIAALKFPFDKILGKSKTNMIGTIQLTDLFGNPVIARQNTIVSLNYTMSDKIELPTRVVIPAGSSFAKFPITTQQGTFGVSAIKATGENIFGSNIPLQIVHFSTKLEIFVEYPPGPITPSEPVSIKVYVDDELGRTIEGADVKFIPDGNSTALPEKVKSAEDGSAVTVFKTTGEKPSLTIEASKQGFETVQRTIEFEVPRAQLSPSPLETGLPEWALYVIGAAIAGGSAVVALRFLRKPKVPTEEEEEEFI